MMANYGIVEYLGLQSSNHCGYCKNPDLDKLSHGVWLHTTRVEDYQRLIDRGWRRSGQYCYKPQMNRTCCPQYTIRCDVQAFAPTKSQKRVLKRFRRFVVDGAASKYRSLRGSARDDSAGNVRSEGGPSAPVGDVGDEAAIAQGPQKRGVAALARQTVQRRPVDKVVTVAAKPAGAWQGAPCRKKKLVRLERRNARLLAKGIDPSTVKRRQPPVRSLDELIDINSADSDAHKFEVQLVAVSSGQNDAQFAASFAEVHALYVKYQTAVHGDEADDVNERQFRRFLCSSPFQAAPPPLGAFHQHYRIDGRLIAVGVVDILPNCVSSKYLFFDPDYAFLSLGTYTALHEIRMVRRLREVEASLQFYYMGFYIHDCPKMRYKGRFGNSYLLCPESYWWCPLEECRPKLDVAKYARFGSSDAADEEAAVDVDRVLVLFRRRPATYADYKRQTKRTAADPNVLEYASLVGRSAAYQMLLYRE